ncbi:MAG TPA: hypothetical protein VEV87_04955 [Chitinophagaceae bacterium]|nr:hypothetical protein [Chitinophagaceae bacterium]
MKFILFILFFVHAINRLYARTYYVDAAKGNDKNDGATIQTA